MIQIYLFHKSARAEILNIKSWAFENQMGINWDKTTELVFRRPNLNHELLPDSVCNIEQVLKARRSHYFW